MNTELFQIINLTDEEFYKHIDNLVKKEFGVNTKESARFYMLNSIMAVGMLTDVGDSFSGLLRLMHDYRTNFAGDGFKKGKQPSGAPKKADWYDKYISVRITMDELESQGDACRLHNIDRETFIRWCNFLGHPTEPQ